MLEPYRTTVKNPSELENMEQKVINELTKKDSIAYLTKDMQFVLRSEYVLWPIENLPQKGYIGERFIDLMMKGSNWRNKN